MHRSMSLSRRAFVAGDAAAAGVAGLRPAWARSLSNGIAAKGFGTLEGPVIDLTIADTQLSVDGRSGHAVAINGSVPAPLLRLKEGQDVRLRVTNHLDEDTSIHWHGLIVPFQMDGVPGVSFPGVRPSAGPHSRQRE